MVYCFVHAPNNMAWNGELVLALRKNIGRFRLKDVQTIIELMYPDDDPDMFHYDNNVAEEKAKVFLLRKHKGYVQRRSLYGSYEDLHYDEWEKTFKERYPDIFFLYNPRRIRSTKDDGTNETGS